MRILMWFSIGFVAACALCAYLLPVSVLIPVGIAMGIAGCLMTAFQKKQWMAIAGILCIGLSVGQLRYAALDAVHLAPVRELDGETVTLTLSAEDFSYETDYGIAVDGKITINGRNYQCRMYLNQTQLLSPGDQVTGSFRLRYTAPGGMEKATHHSGKGILLLAYPKGEHTVKLGEPAWYHAPAILRQKITLLMEALFHGDVLPFVKALLLGDTSDMSYKMDSDLALSGLRHVAAVSGLHVSVLFSAVYLFSGRRRGLTVAIGIPVLLIFAAVAGFSPSILRASIMQLLVLLGLALKREYDPPTALAFALLAMLAYNPLSVTSAGLQLSAASVAGILLFGGRIKGWLLDEKRFGRWGKSKLIGKAVNTAAASVSISISALITTTPLTAFYFGSVSLLGAATNLLCLWVVTVLFCGIIAACVVGALWLQLGRTAAWLLSWLARYILAVAGLVAKIPMAAVYTASVYIVAWLIFCYVLLGIFLCSRKKRPLVMVCCAVIGLCASLLASWTEPLLDTYRVTVLDVGQGQCVLLQSQGRTYMVDCGGDYGEDAADTAAVFLQAQGVFRLDGVILTHYDKDHVGGVEYLLQRIGTDMLVLPEGDAHSYWDERILQNHTGMTLRNTEDLNITWGSAAITVFDSWTTESSNESSSCVLFHTEKCDILITGDRSVTGEEILLRESQIPKLDALVIGHHGASSSTGEYLLRHTQPETALISVGEGNRYGHPSRSVLDRLAAYGCIIRRTDLEGTIIYRG